jgi:hypothetical protein
MEYGEPIVEITAAPEEPILGPTLEDLPDPHAACNERLDRTENQLSEAHARISRVFREFDQFKAHVREVAIQAHHDGHFCKSGMNEKLRELDLEPYQTKYSVFLDVRVYAYVQGADDEDVAVEWAKNAIRVETTDDDVYSIEVDEIELRSVEGLDD